MIDRFLIALCHHHFLSEWQFVLHGIVLVYTGLGFFLTRWLKEKSSAVLSLVGLTKFFFHDLKSNVGDVYHIFCCDNKPKYFSLRNSLKW